MVRLFRARAFCLIAAVLLTAGAATATSEELLHGGRAHDVACASAEATHDASSHRYDGPAEERGGDHHCVGCHFARSLRIGASVASVVAHEHERRLPRPIAAIGSVRSAALERIPSRSPPRLS